MADSYDHLPNGVWSFPLHYAYSNSPIPRPTSTTTVCFTSKKVSILLKMHFFQRLGSISETKHRTACRLAMMTLCSSATAAALLRESIRCKMSFICSRLRDKRIRQRTREIQSTDSSDPSTSFPPSNRSHSLLGLPALPISPFNLFYSSDPHLKLILLSHWIGDIHQPLHVDLLCDEGGNFYNVTWFGNASCDGSPYFNTFHEPLLYYSHELLSI